MIKYCKVCKKMFETKNKLRLYCSKKCRMKALDARRKSARGERKAKRKRLAEERKNDLHFLIYEKDWMEKRGFTDG